MRFAIIENGVVANVAIADSPIEENWIASDDACIGDLYSGGVFEKPLPDYDGEWVIIRAERNAKLAASDWTQLPDAPVDAAEWAEYRQELRDVTDQTDPFDIAWPTAPGA